MKIKIILILILSFSCTFAQNELSLVIQQKSEIQTSYQHNYNWIANTKPDETSSHHYSFLNLSGQAVVGSALAVAFALPPLTAEFAASWGSRTTTFTRTALGILSISSYIFGAGVGVHWVAKGENPTLSFWKTIGASTAGGGAGILFASVLAVYNTKISDVVVTIILLTPVIGSMIYASIISDWPEDNQAMFFYKNCVAQKDLVQQTNLFNLELLKIKL
ncbi:MAG TPA: hypothetical protein VKA26_03985 [Ignavibacteriaceae bacterium]|nr:hypothetical protein [Ignavibacteriaceae bacterium]